MTEPQQDHAMSLKTAFDFQNFQKERLCLIEERLSTYMSGADPDKLWEAMRYSVLSGGKRIRAILCLTAAEASAQFYKGDPSAPSDFATRPIELALPCACAIELVHAMSLIHDDLPCMDDDDFRRGKASNHKVFGEAIALLAGDNLLVLANELLLKESSKFIRADRLIEVAAGLSAASGAKGMVGGQILDMELTGKTSADKSDAELLAKIHERKTAALISFSVWSGAALMDAPEPLVKCFAEFGKILGLSFQIADDLLDETGNINSLGKTPGKDKLSGKLTWLSLYGMEKSKAKLWELKEEGSQMLFESGLSQDLLAPFFALLDYAITRTN